MRAARGSRASACRRATRPGDVRERLAPESSGAWRARCAAAGYFGPFGVDAYTYRDRLARATCDLLQPRSEVNARYSMGFALTRAELEARR